MCSTCAQISPTWQSYAGLPPEEGARVMLLPTSSTFLSTGIDNHSVTFCPYRDSSLALRMTRRQEGTCYFHTKNTAPKGGAFLCSF